MAKLRVAIHGAAGRMGQRLIALGSADADFQIVAAIDSPSHPRIGEDAGVIAGVASLGVPLSGRFDGQPEVVIDFSIPAGAEAITKLCLERRLPLVVATTGLSDVQQQMLRDAAMSIPLL